MPGGSYFFTVTLTDRRSTILTDHVDMLRLAFTAAQHERPFAIDAIVVLPEHLHAVWTLPPGDMDYSGRWRRIKGHFSQHLLKAGVPLRRRSNGSLSLWQRRFWEHTIRDDQDFERHIDYVHFNPVKHGMVRQVSQWPHSSFHRYVRDGILPLDWGGMVEDEKHSFGEPV